MAVRLNLILSEDLHAQIEQCAATPDDKALLIRKALALYLEATRAAREKDLGLALFDRQSREIRTEIVGF